MPIIGKVQPSPAQSLFFKSLKEFDNWVPGTAPKRHDGIIKYTSRKPAADALNRGKLLVCHDYKGGYTESLFDRCYTFNFWSSCDTFIYFSHHRVTVPPPGWISAAHRQGVKMLGTLIFEGGGEEDCLRLLVGKIPHAKTGQIDQGSGVEQTRALSAWSHGETIWYDSVIISGRLAWQDRLNSLNLPFFFLWRPDYPALSAQYFLSLDAALIGNTPESYSQRTTKTVQDIYMGVDIWGRGSHGGGGFGSYKAITHIAPESLGLSVALFGQAWTWESEQDKPGWSWDKWWEYDSKLWVGSVTGPVEVPEAPRRKDEPECPHGPFLPITSFFPRHPHLILQIWVAWFVDALKWTDVDKQTSVGDLLWPSPNLFWDDEREDDLPMALSAFCMDDAWNGGTRSGFPDLAAYRPLWIPIQSLYITPQKQYIASLVYKLDDLPEGVDTEFGLNLNHFQALRRQIYFNIAIGLRSEQPFETNILLGQLNVFAYVPETFREEDTIPFSGTLSWEVATCFPPVTSISITSPEDPVSAWNQQPTITWFPSFLYFNIYAQVFTDEYNVGTVDTASWIGTSGWDGQKNGFDIRPDNLPSVVPPNRKVRFYVRGVTDRGEVMKWDKCAYVDLTG
ncbi:glycoside hydrolase family 85 protein [Pholiota molesta]|nr:glycoside hydrolase family 85 protein [Pholiota molesta]